ncbi:MAG: nuclear transport factor 2 family protein [Acidobacteriaceae bacterium]|nr:nuclear transport factor 2 family protein [Acidobacteriaceae bacterium]
MRLTAFLFTALLTTLPATPLTAQEQSNVLVPPQLRVQLVADLEHQQLDDVMSLFTTDATWVDSNAHSFSGGPAIRSMLADLFAHKSLHVQLTLTNQRLNGEPYTPSALQEFGTYLDAIQAKNKASISRECGLFHFTYTRNPEGGWLISRAEWTTRPCPAVPVAASR